MHATVDDEDKADVTTVGTVHHRDVPVARNMVVRTPPAGRVFDLPDRLSAVFAQVPADRNERHLNVAFLNETPAHQPPAVERVGAVRRTAVSAVGVLFPDERECPVLIHCASPGCSASVYSFFGNAVLVRSKKVALAVTLTSPTWIERRIIVITGKRAGAPVSSLA